MSLANYLNAQSKTMEFTYVPKSRRQIKNITADETYTIPFVDTDYAMNLATDNAENLTVNLPQGATDLEGATIIITGYLGNTGTTQNSHTLRIVKSPSDLTQDQNTLDFEGNSAYNTLVMDKLNDVNTGSYILRGWWNGNQWEFSIDYDNSAVDYTGSNP